MQLQGLEQAHGSIWEGQLELAIREVHFNGVLLQEQELSIGIVHVAIAIDFHLRVRLGLLLADIDWALLVSDSAEWLDITPVVATCFIVPKVQGGWFWQGLWRQLCSLLGSLRRSSGVLCLC